MEIPAGTQHGVCADSPREPVVLWHSGFYWEYSMKEILDISYAVADAASISGHLALVPE